MVTKAKIIPLSLLNIIINTKVTRVPSLFLITNKQRVKFVVEYAFPMPDIVVVGVTFVLKKKTLKRKKESLVRTSTFI